MKITADFYSLDDAEFAAAAIRRNTDGIYDINITEKRINPHRDGSFAPMGFISGLSTGYSSAVPVPAVQPAADNSYSDPKSASIEIICRPSSARRVSAALISRNAHNIRGT